MRKLAALSMVFGTAILLAAGCATTGKGLSDEEQIAQRIEEGLAAVKALNFDAFDGFVSESFDSSAVGDKEDLLDYLENANSMGFLKDLEVDLSEAVTTINGLEAEVAPVYVSGVFGSLTLDFTGVKENGVWYISGVEPGF